MMKNYLLLLLVALYSCTTSPIRTATTNDKADFGISKPTKALFFVQNENLKANEKPLKEHTELSNKIYNSFGGATDKLLVGRTNAKTFKFSNGTTTWYVDVNTFTKPTAMILFDGEHFPLIEYKTSNYENLIKRHLQTDFGELKQNTPKVNPFKNRTSKTIDSIWAIPFTPTQDYAYNLIKYSNNRYYPLAPLARDKKCNGPITYNVFSDLEMKKKVYDYTTTYKDGRILTSRSTINGKTTSIRYYFNKLDLIDSIATFDNDKWISSTGFKYLKDRFVVIYGNTREEYLFNKIGKIATLRSYTANNNIRSEYHYVYDDFGRVETEKYFSDGKLESTSVYQYPYDDTTTFSRIKNYDAQNNLITENLVSDSGGIDRNALIRNGRLILETESFLNKDCIGKIISYDGDRKVQSVVMQTRN